MILKSQAGLSVLLCALTTQVSLAESAVPVPLSSPQTRAATYDEVRRHQALGRFVVAPDGSFFLYEWSRPYDWAPNPSGLDRAVGMRMQTFLYKIVAVDGFKPNDPPTSEELLPPMPGATYYLGSLSPDALHVSLYELDWDDRKLRSGVVRLGDSVPAKVTWFEVPPDDTRLDQAALWVSEDELIYPVKSGPTNLARGRVSTGKTELCSECAVTMLVRKSESAFDARGAVTSESEELIEMGKKIATSQNGVLSIYVADTSESIALWYAKRSRTVRLFQNNRKPKGAAIVRE